MAEASPRSASHDSHGTTEVTRDIAALSLRQYGATIGLEKSSPRTAFANVTLNDSTFAQLQDEGVENLCVKITLKDLTSGKTSPGTLHTSLRSDNNIRLNYSFELGHNYDVEITIMKVLPGNRKSEIKMVSKIVKYREFFRKSELEELLNQAKLFTQQNRSNWEIKSAYRSISWEYAHKIGEENISVMKGTIKDNNGDPGCPASGQIKGLFFSVQPDKNNPFALPRRSLFGPIRCIIPIEKFIEPDVNLYFADFFCCQMYRKKKKPRQHYVTLVAAKQNSTADNFCEENLIKLPEFNQFVKKVGKRFFCCKQPQIEILYTEDIDPFSEYIQWTVVPTIGHGSAATPGGVPKTRGCDICNLSSSD